MQEGTKQQPLIINKEKAIWPNGKPVYRDGSVREIGVPASGREERH